MDDETIAELVRRHDAAVELVWTTEERPYTRPIEFSEDETKSRHRRKAIVKLDLTHDYGPGFPQLVADLAVFESIEGVGLGSNAIPRPDDIDAICRLSFLSSLSINGWRVTDELIGHVKQLVNLRYLGLHSSGHFGVSPCTGKTLGDLDALPKLEWLTLDGLKDWSPEAAAEVIKIESLRKFQAVRMPLTDADVAVLVGRKDWVRLSFGVTSVTNESLRLVGGLPNLTHFKVDGEGITSAGIKDLAASRSLEWLDLRFCPNLDDAAVDALADMPKLRTVQLNDNNKITATAVRRLGTKRPKLLIQHPATDHRERNGLRVFFE